MSAYGHKAKVKTWYELIVVTKHGNDDQHYIKSESLGHFPVQSMAHAKAKKHRHILVPLESDKTHKEWFEGHSRIGDTGYYLHEVDLAHEDGRKTFGRVVTNIWVYPTGVRKGGPRKRKKPPRT